MNCSNCTRDLPKKWPSDLCPRCLGKLRIYEKLYPERTDNPRWDCRKEALGQKT